MVTQNVVTNGTGVDSYSKRFHPASDPTRVRSGYVLLRNGILSARKDSDANEDLPRNL